MKRKKLLRKLDQAAARAEQARDRLTDLLGEYDLRLMNALAATHDDDDDDDFDVSPDETYIGDLGDAIVPEVDSASAVRPVSVSDAPSPWIKPAPAPSPDDNEAELDNPFST